MFFRRQVLVKAAPGAKVVPSGTFTSETNWARSQPAGGGVVVGVGVAEPGVEGGGGVTLGRAMMGLDQRARSPVAGPVARTVRMNLTSRPDKALRSRSVRKKRPSYFS